MRKRNIFSDFRNKIAKDYYEWWSYLVSFWNVQTDNRRIKRALKRGRIKNAGDKRTYYILRDKTGGINELNKSEINMLVKAGIFAKRSHMQIISDAIDIVCKNSQIQEEFNQEKLRKEAINDTEG